MAFQPIVELSGETVLGFEALARFPGEQDPSPRRWFLAADALGMRHELELAAAASSLRQLDLLPDHAFVALNVSPITAGGAGMRQLLEEVDPTRVVLEVKEDASVVEYPRYSAAIEALRDHGVRIALDDTGTGNVGLQHLLDVRPDVLKIDTEVTRDIDRDPARQAIASAFGSLADRAGALSLAEGVETVEELDMLRSLGIGASQGFLFGRPELLDA
jgi:EAL domain-containing protein (putative c-di-GMP-specific phosphodiesterase class I)